jgi:hypothetical protein
MASLTINIYRLDDAGNEIIVGAHYSTDTGISGSRSVGVPKTAIATGDDIERAIVAEVRRHCQQKWGLDYTPGTDRIYFLGQIKVIS